MQARRPGPGLGASLNQIPTRASVDDLLRWESLPDWREVFAAVCGHTGDTPDSHPVTRCARALTELEAAHSSNPDTPSFEVTRLAQITSIDLWVLQHAPFVAECDTSLGQVVYRMACACISMPPRSCGPNTMNISRTPYGVRSGARAVEWTDLVDEVVHGQSRRSGPDPHALH